MMKVNNMAQLVKKTPMELFGSDNVQVKPDRYALRGSRVNAPKDQLPENGLSPLYYGNRVTYTKLYNGMPAQAQKAANESGAVYGTHDPKEYYPRWNSPRKINPLPKSNVGPYGHVAFPEQWKYKTGTDIANAMTRAAKIDTTDEDSIWDAFEGGKITEEQRNKMLSERTGRIANKGRNAK